MEILIFIVVLSSLLATSSSITEVSHNSCSHKLKEAHLEHHRHLNGSGIHLTLHHPRSPCSPAPLPPLPFSDILLHDSSRAAHLSSRLTKTHKTSQTHHSQKAKIPKTPHPTTSSAVPLNPGASVGVGNYVTKIGLGTPPTNYIVVVDTGSSLSWLQCSPCKVSCHEQSGPIFNPAASTTYHPVPCSAPECSALASATLNPSACGRSNICIYEATYGDSSFSVGYLSRDTLTLSPTTLPGFVYGCGQDNEGLFGSSAGLVGLAKNKLSLLSQLSTKLGSSSFSYCLSTSSSVGFLSIGTYNPAKFSFTPMASNSADATLYFVNLIAITVSGKGIPVSAAAYKATPTIIDSGTVITRLPSDVYSAFSKAVVSAMAGRQRAPAYSLLDTCFKGSAASGVAAPPVSLVFEGGAELRLGSGNVLIDVDGGTTCLAFAASGSVAIIGNRQQQTFEVVYDVGSSRIGFAAGGCR